MIRQYNFTSIRALLTEGFTDEELRILCFDLFKPVHDQLSSSMGKTEIVQQLLQYVEQKELIESLLNQVKERNPNKYETYQPYHTNVSPYNQLIPQLQEVLHHAFVGYSRLDGLFASELKEHLKLQGYSLLLQPDSLLAENALDLFDLETNLRQCHSAILILSETSLNQMNENRKRTDRILEMLANRTGQLYYICRNEMSLNWAKAQKLSTIFDFTNWEDQTKQAQLIAQIQETIAGFLPRQPSRMVGVPCMIVALTEKEAISLVKHPEQLEQDLERHTFEQLQRLRGVLAEYKLEEFLKRYGATRDQWQPFIDRNQNIRQIIEEVVRHLNRIRPRQLQGYQIKIQYYSFDTLQEPEFINIFDEITRLGCVVILDEVSLFHPVIRKTFFRHRLFSGEQVTLVTLSPYDPYKLTLNHPNMIIEDEVKEQLKDIFNRFAMNYDPKYEFGMSDESRLKRWLYSRLPETLHSSRQPPPNINKLSQFSEKYGQGSTGEMPSFFNSTERIL